MSSHGPVEPEFVEMMNKLARTLDVLFNPQLAKDGDRHIGFTLLVFEFDNIDGGRMNYISNAKRADMITAMKELIANFEGRVMPDARNQ